MTDDIRKNIARAYVEESTGADRNAAFVLKALQEGHPNLARLFRAVADGKAVHTRRFRLLLRGKIGESAENLKDALKRERDAVERGYPAMVETAMAGTKAVKKAFLQSRKTDDEYSGLFKKAMENSDAGEDCVYYVCQICGHIHRDVIPDNCPICKAVPGRFKKVS
jgi:rubrerythrin